MTLSSVILLTLSFSQEEQGPCWQSPKQKGKAAVLNGEWVFFGSTGWKGWGVSRLNTDLPLLLCQILRRSQTAGRRVGVWKPRNILAPFIFDSVSSNTFTSIWQSTVLFPVT